MKRLTWTWEQSMYPVKRYMRLEIRGRGGYLLLWRDHSHPGSGWLTYDSQDGGSKGHRTLKATIRLLARLEAEQHALDFAGAD